MSCSAWKRGKLLTPHWKLLPYLWQCSKYMSWYIICLFWRVRKACHWLVNLRHFDNFILVIILISSVLLALEDPVYENSKRNQVRSRAVLVAVVKRLKTWLPRRLFTPKSINGCRRVFRKAWLTWLVASCQGNRDKLRPGGHLERVQTSTLWTTVENRLFGEVHLKFSSITSYSTHCHFSLASWHCLN